MKKLGQEPAFASRATFGTNHYKQIGMSKRFYAAYMLENDFDNLGLKLQEAIIGEERPKRVSGILLTKAECLEYVKWLTKGRAIWKYIQADELLKQENQK